MKGNCRAVVQNFVYLDSSNQVFGEPLILKVYFSFAGQKVESSEVFQHHFCDLIPALWTVILPGERSHQKAPTVKETQTH